MDKPKVFRARRLLPLLTAALLLFPGGNQAEAGYLDDLYDRFQQFSELPDEIQALKDSYRHTLQELDRARTDAEAYRQQNADLAEQNRRLADMVVQLQEAEAARQRSADRLKVTALVGVGLLAGYFLLTRLLRFGMRRRNRRW